MSEPAKQAQVARSESITIKVTPKEKAMIGVLAKYLHVHEKIKNPYESEAVRMCLHYTYGEIIKGIESQRYGGAIQP